MFQDLQEKLSGVFRTLTGKSRLSEANMADALREIRRALLEADVELGVVRDFVARVTEQARGDAVLAAVQPGEQVVKIVHDELVRLLGGQASGLRLDGVPPHVILVMGLQGSGKTTFAAKLAKRLREDGRKPFLAACDLQRPAAIDQLEILAQQVGVGVHADRQSQDVVAVAKAARAAARAAACDTLIVDTAGRLQIDAELMQQLAELQRALTPSERLLVLDAMTGQEAVNIARSFHEQIGITGSVLTKLDGDTRGGAALSLVSITGQPIKYVGVGERVADLDVFHPDRIAGRILGMGDVVSLVERAQQHIDEEKALEMEAKLRRAEFSFEDFLDQLQQIKKMGSLKTILGLMPGMNAKLLKAAKVDDRQLLRTEAIIHSMTPRERQHPNILNGSRRKRIAKGSGSSLTDVNRLLKQYRDMKKMMKTLSKPGAMDRLSKQLMGQRQPGIRGG